MIVVPLQVCLSTEAPLAAWLLARVLVLEGAFPIIAVASEFEGAHADMVFSDRRAVRWQLFLSPPGGHILGRIPFILRQADIRRVESSRDLLYGIA